MVGMRRGFLPEVNIMLCEDRVWLEDFLCTFASGRSLRDNRSYRFRTYVHGY